MKRLEELDKRIIELLNERAGIYIEELKKNGSSGFRLEDMSEVNSLIDGAGAGPLQRAVLKRIFAEVISASAAASLPVSVSCLGPEGSFSSQALYEIFGSSVNVCLQKTITDVFTSVESDSSEFGVVPVENSTEGAVTYTLDELMETDLNVIAEHYLRVSYSLLSKSDNIKSIKKIYSFSQPLGQCKNWVRSNIADVEIIGVDSTSKAAEMASMDPDSAAISSPAAAGLYGLNALAQGIEDLRQNYTRFFVLGRKASAPTGRDKTSIALAVKDKPGALYDLLKPFDKAGINMTKIESRPDKKKMWEYNFFIDFLGHRDEEKIKTALDKMKEETLFLKILGSYPVGNNR